MNHCKKISTCKRLRQASISDFFGQSQVKKKRKMEQSTEDISIGDGLVVDSQNSDVICLDSTPKEDTEDTDSGNNLSPQAVVPDSIKQKSKNTKPDVIKYEDVLKNWLEDEDSEKLNKEKYKLEVSQDSEELFNHIQEEKRKSIQNLMHLNIKENSDIDSSQEIQPLPSTSKNRLPDHNPGSGLIKIYQDEEELISEVESTPSLNMEDKQEERSWGGVDVTELKRTPECDNDINLPPYPDSKFSCVLYDSSYSGDSPPPCKEWQYKDIWDGDYVRLPCSRKSLYPVSHGNEKRLVSRWELIESALLDQISNSIELEEAIFKYNTRFERKFKALHEFFMDVLEPGEAMDFFENTLPKMIELALSINSLITKPIPLLKRQKQNEIFLTQQQIACLLANAFFSTFPRRNSTARDSEYSNYPTINFNRLFEGYVKVKREKAHMEKLKTLIHYFKRICTKMPTGVVSFERRVINDFPLWNKSPCHIKKLHVSRDGLIEKEGQGFLQIDFANKRVGGGVLFSGLVQEEIRFIICPELILSRLFTEVLDNNEALIVKGCEQYSTYSGYAETYQWTGDFVDQTTCDKWRRKNTEIAVIDATRFERSREQYRPGNVRRELNKAYCGFYSSDPDHAPAIATGNWGCGAFKGDPLLKCTIQLMAASSVNRDLCYFTFNDGELMTKIEKMYNMFKEKEWTIAELWNIISKYNEEIVVPNSKKNNKFFQQNNFYKYINDLSSAYDTSTDDNG